MAESGLNPLHTHACLTRFSSIITVNTLGWIILCWRGGQWGGGQCRCYPGYGRMCNSIAGLSPRDASSISWLVPTKNLCRHCHMTSERQNHDQLRTTDVLEALPGLLGAALDQRDRALPGAGCSKVLYQLPSSYCSPHRARSPWSRGDMSPWNNPTLLDHVLFSRACEDLLPAYCTSAPEGWLSVSAEWGGRHAKHANYAFWTQTRTQGSSDEGWWWRWEEKDGRLSAGASLESWLSLQICGWPLQTPAAAVVGGRCGCSSHIFDPSAWRPQNHHICQQKKPLRAPGFLLKSTFSLEKFSLYFSLGGHFSPRNSNFFFFSWKGRKESRNQRHPEKWGSARLCHQLGGPHPQQPPSMEYSQLCRRKMMAPQTSLHPPQMELSLPFLLEEITLRWPLGILDHSWYGVGLF